MCRFGIRIVRGRLCFISCNRGVTVRSGGFCKGADIGGSYQGVISRKFRQFGSMLIWMFAGSIQRASGKGLGLNGVGCVIVPSLGVGRMGWHGKAGQ